MQRRYSAGSTLSEGGLILDLAPGLGDTGIDETPQFFHGFARHPLVLARGLLTLAEITRTRYFRPEPQDNRDPVLTAGGDVLRAECFSACNGVYARFDLHGEAFEAGTIGHGTTNVDLGPATVNMLGALPRTALLHLDIGAAAMTVSTPDRIEYERKVNMPDRWIPALGNVSALMEKAQHRFTVGAAAARRALAGVPTSNTGRDKRLWWKSIGGLVQQSTHSSPGAVGLPGAHRLSAVKRLGLHLESMSVYAGSGITVVEFGLPDATLTLGLSDETHRGFSGEGMLLRELASPRVEEDVDIVSSVLSFEPTVDISQLVDATDVPGDRVSGALAYLAAEGRLGWDSRKNGRRGAYFRRELPVVPTDRVDRANPRLAAARRLIGSQRIEQDHDSPGTFMVPASTGGHYRVTENRCSCRWYMRYQGLRGPCKHVLAVRMLATESVEQQGEF